MSFSHSELDFLFAHPELIISAEQLTLSKKSMLADIATLRKTAGNHARALVEIVLARRAASKKMDPAVAHNWWADSDAVQQATPEGVAEWRAKHLASLGVGWVHDVTCSVGTELRILHAEGVDAVGSDVDVTRLRMAKRNVAPVGVFCADATRPATSAPVVVADPARRNSSGRISSLADVVPSVEDLLAAYPARTEFAIKCAPGIDFNDVREWAGMVDVVSVDRQVKEACVYTPGLMAGAGGGRFGPVVGDLSATACAAVGPGAEGGVFREGNKLLMRAVVLRAEAAPQIVTSTMDDNVGEGAPGKYIIDPDGAIVRAGLVRHYAAQHGLWQLDHRIAYLTGDVVPAGERGFRVLEEVPPKQLRGALAARGVGTLEILVRGVDVDPDVLRKKLKLKGAQQATVVLTRVGSAATAFICEVERG
ncbi:SAM-dependent methyltransferase [Corynebacterium auriscanis]|uniref:THUMP-like domain-containing protein n=1 Tax=Corynebacterium auriscanis TaxID=99807 RepID=UPI003CF5A44F